MGNTSGNKPSRKQASEWSENSQLRSFFLDELMDIYWAEKHLVKTLPKIAKAASSEELAGAVDEHLEQTRGHVKRLEEAFDLLGEKAQARKCEAMEGILKEGEDIMDDTRTGTATRDVGLIMAAQKVEHYEIATYGALATLASTLELQDVEQLLRQTLAEEKEADEKLTRIAENRINYEAAGEME